jgi:hypothetical protein
MPVGEVRPVAVYTVLSLCSDWDKTCIEPSNYECTVAIAQASAYLYKEGTYDAYF